MFQTTWPTEQDIASLDAATPTYVLDAESDSVQPLQAIRFLADPESAKKVHPLITAGTVTSTTSDDSSGARRSVVHFVDTLNLCGYLMNTEYDAVMALQPTKGRKPPLRAYFYTETSGVRVAHSLEVSAKAGGGSCVRQKVVIEAPWYLRFYVVRTARKAHTEALESSMRYLSCNTS